VGQGGRVGRGGVGLLKQPHSIKCRSFGPMNIVEVIRKKAVESVFSTDTVQSCWPVWSEQIQRRIGANPRAEDLLNLGNHLSEIFTSTGGTGRGQGEVSAGGTAWESLVAWYVNLCTAGTRVVAIKKMSLVPKPIQDAITVNYGNFSCNTESDITVIIFPDMPLFTADAAESGFLNSNGQINYAALDRAVADQFSDFSIGIIQCKTNWNDNAQIPMLWDMIYSAGGFRGRNITIGRNSFSIQMCASFTYAFITVPSNVRAQYKSDSVAVKRVTNLSGGNYWGKETKENVARSIKEIFANNYMPGYSRSILQDMSENLEEFRAGGRFEYFRFR
jgi:hypothetical protein